MNNLSIFIYLADLIPAIGSLCFGFAVVSGIGMFVSAMIYDFNRVTFYRDNKYEKEETAFYRNCGSKGLKFFPITFLVCCIIGTIIPSRNTIMMIAASEFGETLYKSEEVKEILNPASKLLKSYINDELNKREKK